MTETEFTSEPLKIEKESLFTTRLFVSRLIELLKIYGIQKKQKKNEMACDCSESYNKRVFVCIVTSKSLYKDCGLLKEFVNFSMTHV